MNKRQLHHRLVRLRPVQPWYFLALGGASGLVAVTALRHNYQTMVSLRTAVFTADEQDGDVESALRDLRLHVYNHMNTDLTSGSDAIYPPIQLKYRYDRLVAQQQAAASGNQNLYSEAQAYCEQQNAVDFSGRNRTPCIAEYVTQHGGSTTAQVSVPDSLYKFDFISPRWSPDVAGWSLVFTGLLLVAGLGLWLYKWWLRRGSS